MGAMRRRRQVLAVFLVAVLLCAPAGFGPGAAVWAADHSLRIEKDGGFLAAPGDENVEINFTISNARATPVTIRGARLEFYGPRSHHVNVTGGLSAIVELEGRGDSVNANFKVDIHKDASPGQIQYRLIVPVIQNNGALVNEVQEYVLDVAERFANRGMVDIRHNTDPLEGFWPGSDNHITFEVSNNGSVLLRDVVLYLTLPEGMWINNDSNTINLGHILRGEKRTRTYPITVDEALAGKTYPITLEVKGKIPQSATETFYDPESGNVTRTRTTTETERDFSEEKSYFIPVLGDGTGQLRDLSIQNISVPVEVTEDQDFTLSFTVRNDGDAAVRDVRVYAELPEGLFNKTAAVFAESRFEPGESRAYSVTLYAAEASGRSYPIKIGAEPLSGEPGGGAVQYVSVFARDGEGSGAATPQLMIDRYSYGGSHVMAGRAFFLNLSLYNTSDKRLSNIKVTLSSEDGAFVPVDSSSSFFVESIGPRGSVERSVHLSAKPSAEQKTTALNVSMSYEDSSGNAFTADDIVSIPVTQETRLTVDEVIPPYECYVGQFSFAEVQFYNMGKTTLNNLIINAEGDFDIMESNSYFVGNMESGHSDSYSFSFLPRQEGPVEGKIVFTYENDAGDKIVHEVPFVFQAMEMPVWDDIDPFEETETSMPWALILFGIVLVLLIVGFLVFRKVRKARQEKKLEIQDASFNTALDLDIASASKQGPTDKADKADKPNADRD